MFKDKKFFIIGAQGQLGKEFIDVLLNKGVVYEAPNEADCDITNARVLQTLIEKSSPDFVINCGAYNDVDQAETQKETAFAVNYEAVSNLADICSKNKIKLVHFSSDYVFDGKKDGLYEEEDEVNPLNVYGKSKLRGEQVVLKLNDLSLVFRLSWVIGKGQQNFLFKLDQWAQKNPVLKIAADEVSVPTFTETVVDVALKALSNELSGLYHLTNSGYASRYELAKYYIQKMKRENFVIPVPGSNFTTIAERPGFSAMSNKKIC
ncbi:MAG: dTDP-4-dehydrorhamnose reductase, partial [Candidatus Omnitrophica bacterium]|nr:dTDP-4-dehydrorhamnose reductase [Candidatus Omnitrophota bacterium]